MSLSIPSVSVNNFFYGNAAATRIQVRAATVVAGTLATSFANGQTIDGIVLATNDRILIKDQVSGVENGIYNVAAAGAPSRAIDYDADQTASGANIYINRGTVNAGTNWTCTSLTDIIGTNALTFTQTGDVTRNGVQTLTNKTLVDDSTFIVDQADATKRLQFQLGSQTTGTTITLESQSTANKTYLIPDTAIGPDFILVGHANQQVNNKRLITGTNTFNNSNLDGRVLRFDTANNNTSTALTMQTNSTTNQTLVTPNLIIDNLDTMIVSKLQQTQYRKTMAGGVDIQTPGLNSFIGQYSLGGNCNNVAFNNSGSIAYIVRGGGSFVEVRNTITGASLGSWATATNPYGICINSTNQYIVVACKGANSIRVFDNTGAVIGTVGAMNSPQFPTPSFEPIPYIYVPSPGNNTVYIFHNINTTPALHSSINTSIATPLAVAVAYNTTEIYIANGGSNNLTWYNGAVYNSNPVTTFGGTINMGAPVTFVAASHQSDVVYACTATTFQYVSTVSKTVTTTLTIGANNQYISLSTDNKYAYICGTDFIYMVNLATQATSTIISLPTTPLDPISAVVTPDGNRLFICGSDGTNQVVIYNVQKTQYSSYAVGTASQLEGDISGLRGVRWSPQMYGGVIVYANGVTADIACDPDNTYALLQTSVAQTVSAQAYTIYYGAATTGPSGLSYLANGSVLIKPFICDNGDSSRKISFNFDNTALGSELIITNNITTSGQTIANIPDITSPDSFVFANTTQTLTGKTLTSPTINNPTISSGSWSSPSITSPTVSGGTFTSPTINSMTASAGTLSTVSIDGGSIVNATVIGGVTPAQAIFTNATANNQFIAAATTNQIRTGSAPNFTTSNYPASAGAVTLTFPNTTDTIVGRATTDTLTNKTLTNPFYSIQASSPITTPPTVTTMQVFAISYASTLDGKTQLAQIVRGANGPYYYEYQPYFGNKKITMVTAPSDTTTAFNTFGMNMQAGAGTLGTIAPLNTNAATCTRRLTLTAAAGAANTSAYLMDTSNRKWLFPGSQVGGVGGFHMIVKFTISDANSVTSVERLFIGLSAAVPTATVNPTASTNLIGLYKNATGTVFGFMANGTTASSGLTAATTIPLSTTSVYEFRMFQYPRANLCYFSLRQFNNPSSETIQVNQLTGTSGTLYPSATVSPIIWLNTAAGTTARTISVISVYVEAEN